FHLIPIGDSRRIGIKSTINDLHGVDPERPTIVVRHIDSDTAAAKVRVERKIGVGKVRVTRRNLNQSALWGSRGSAKQSISGWVRGAPQSRALAVVGPADNDIEIITRKRDVG